MSEKPKTPNGTAEPSRNGDPNGNWEGIANLLHSIADSLEEGHRLWAGNPSMPRFAWNIDESRVPELRGAAYFLCCSEQALRYGQKLVPEALWNRVTRALRRGGEYAIDDVASYVMTDYVHGLRELYSDIESLGLGVQS